MVRRMIIRPNGPLPHALRDLMALVLFSLQQDKFHGEWNYTILPRTHNG